MKPWVKKNREEIHKWAYNSYLRTAKSGDRSTILQQMESDVNDSLSVMRTAWSLQPDDRLYFYWCRKLNKHFHVFDHPVEEGNSECAYCEEQEREKL